MSEKQNLYSVARQHAGAIAIGIALVTLLSLCVAYRLTHHPVERHAIAFYPGLYRRVPMKSGDAVSTAMHAVYVAPDPPALDTAIADIQKMIDAGDAEAAFRLGRYYHLESTEPDYALALKYYQIAVDQNHAWATNNVGLLYRGGLGVVRNTDRAYEYFERAADENSPWAYVNLADMTADRRRVKADANGSIAWLEKGAANHCTLCLIEEAAAYHSGTYGVIPDASKTLALLNQAAAWGDAQATLIIAEMHVVGDGVPQSSTKAFELLKSLSDQGFSEATNLMGELTADNKIRDYLFTTYLGGVQQIPTDLINSLAQNPAGSIHYWELASQQGNCQSLINLSSVFDRGVGVATNHQQAADYVARAVRCDPTNSFYLWKLAARYDEAKGVARDCESAERLYRQSLNHGYADAAVSLGYIYDKGCDSIARDDNRAFRIYLLGAKLGVALCQNNVGAMLKHGRGVTSADPARGYGWIKLAALQGDELAKKNLNDPLFTAEVRAIGLANLTDIKARLLTTAPNPQAILRDPWY